MEPPLAKEGTQLFLIFPKTLLKDFLQALNKERSEDFTDQAVLSKYAIIPPLLARPHKNSYITKYLLKNVLVMGMSQLLVYLPAARTSQVAQVHAQQSLISPRTGRPAARGGERGQSRGSVSGLRSGGHSSEPE